MVVDIHTHIAYSKLYPKDYLVGMFEDENLPFSKAKVLAVLKLIMNDKSCKRVIRQMDESGIAHAVLLIIDGELGMGAPDLKLEEIFELHRHVTDNFPGRFSVFAGLDPRRGEDGLKLFRKSLEQYNFKGLKLYPPMGFGLCHPMLDAYYSICGERGLPVLIHTGPSQNDMANAFASPKYVHEAAKKYPKTNFILAHAGFRLHSPEYDDLLPCDNIFYDLAGFQAAYPQVNEQMIDELGRIFREDYCKKVLFGSDWPLFYMTKKIATCLDLFMNFTRAVTDENDPAVKDILRFNSQRLLNLDYS